MAGHTDTVNAFTLASGLITGGTLTSNTDFFAAIGDRQHQPCRHPQPREKHFRERTPFRPQQL